MDCIGYGAHNDKGLLVPIEFKRRFGFGLSVSLLSSCFFLFGEAGLLCRRFSMSVKRLWSWLTTSVSVCRNRIAGPDDVTFRITHCGVCYAEVKWVFNKIGTTKYPIVPGYVCSKVCILYHFWKLHLKFCSSRMMFLSCASMLPEFFSDCKNSSCYQWL
jgi:hypothetical protein